MPEVSIILPAYNSEKFLASAMKSVLNQSFKDWELIVVDDCSTDKTKRIAECFAEKDSRVKVIQAETNGGAGAARNIAMDHASGQYYAFIDADDLWVRERLEKQMKFMKDNNHAITYSSYVCVGEDLKPKDRGYTKAVKELDYKSYMKNTQVSMDTIIIDVSKTGRPPMPKERGVREDFEMHMALLKKGFKDEVLSFYRVREGQSSANKLDMARVMLKRYMQEKDIAVHKRLIRFGHYAVNATAKRLKSAKDVSYDKEVLSNLKDKSR
ncbi:MAG: glycosyltransferase family 2 protein [Alphaproteobacteria bacterium]